MTKKQEKELARKHKQFLKDLKAEQKRCEPVVEFLTAAKALGITFEEMNVCKDGVTEKRFVLVKKELR